MTRALRSRIHFQSLEDFRREIDEIFRSSLGSRGRSAALVAFPPVEAFFDGDEYVIKLDLPGIDPKEIEVTASGDVVTVRGSRGHHDKQEQLDFIHCEVAHGNFERSVAVPHGIRTGEIKTAYKHGVVELRMPAPKETTRRKVPIQVGTTKAKSA